MNYIDGLPEIHEVEVRAGCGHVVVLLNPNLAELDAMTEGLCPGCAMQRIDCGFDDLERLLEERKAILRKYEGGRRQRRPMKGTP